MTSTHRRPGRVKVRPSITTVSGFAGLIPGTGTVLVVGDMSAEQLCSAPPPVLCGFDVREVRRCESVLIGFVCASTTAGQLLLP